MLERIMRQMAVFIIPNVHGPLWHIDNIRIGRAAIVRMDRFGRRYIFFNAGNGAGAGGCERVAHITDKILRPLKHGLIDRHAIRSVCADWTARERFRSGMVRGGPFAGALTLAILGKFALQHGAGGATVRSPLIGGRRREFGVCHPAHSASNVSAPGTENLTALGSPVCSASKSCTNS